MSFIDVPGHEKLIHTMIAGASGIEMCLLVVAANEGVMPQTLEHLSIMRMLGIQKLVIVLSKIDLVDEVTLLRCQQQVFDLCATFAWQPLNTFHVSAKTQQGVESLQHWLIEKAKLSHTVVQTYSAFRVALDRVFTLPGKGLIVTGSVISGKVQIGEHLCVAANPNKHWRVKSLHTHNSEQTQVMQGERVAIGLAGIDSREIKRGHILCSPEIALTTRCIDVELYLSPHVKKALHQRTQVLFHTADQQAVATMHLLGQSQLDPGAKAFAQLLLDREVSCWNHDRFVLRHVSARETLGGGVILSAEGQTRHRQSDTRLKNLALLAQADIKVRNQALIQQSVFGVAVVSICQYNAWREPPSWLAEGAISLSTSKESVWLIHKDNFEKLAVQIEVLLRQFHQKKTGTYRYPT